jgi:hypothetical protein
LCLSDFDPDGEEISNSFARTIRDDYGIRDIIPIKVALTGEQVRELALPPKLKAKETSSNYDRFVNEHGDHAYELEAVDPETLERILTEAVDSVIDIDLFNAEIDRDQEDAAKLDAIRGQANKLFGSISLQGHEAA